MPSIPIKNKFELDSMRRSCSATKEILREVSEYIEPGMTTREVDAFAASLIKRAGGKSAFLGYKGFSGNICISVNEEVVHGIGGDRKILYGDVVKLDIGMILDGWVGDTATSVAVGAVSEDVERLLRETQQALYRGIAAARAGKRVGDISRAIEQHVHACGYSVVREFVGHGLGKRLHEEPQVPNYGRAGTGPKLRPGMVIAIEPMVNMGGAGIRVLKDGWTVVSLDGKASAHFEHDVLITREGPEVLTRQPREVISGVDPLPV